MINTHRDRISDTVTWLPSQYGMPMATAADVITAAAEDLQAAIQSPKAAPILATMVPSRVTALKELATILTNTDATATIEPSTIIPTSTTSAKLPRVPSTETTTDTNNDWTVVSHKSPQKVTFVQAPLAPLPKTPVANLDTPTYSALTGAPGKKHRNRLNAQRRKANALPAAPPNTPPAPSHHHNTRSTAPHFSLSAQHTQEIVTELNDTIHTLHH